MRTKDFAVAVKAAGSDDGLRDGQVKMLVSVFGNVDAYGDMVMPGAFADDLDRWRSKGDPIPFIWSHQWSDPFAYLGTIDPTDAKETADGLEVIASLDTSENPKAAQVYALLKARSVTNASFAYDIDDAEWVEHEDEKTGGTYQVYELRKLRIIEAGPCLVGANRETELLAAKTADDLHRLAGTMKAGTPITAADATAIADGLAAVGQAWDAMKNQLAGAGERQVGVEQPDGAKDSGEGQVTERTSDNRSTQHRARLALLDL